MSMLADLDLKAMGKKAGKFTDKQKESFLDFVETRESFRNRRFSAGGYTQKDWHREWMDLAEQLNDLGPPVKDAEGWRGTVSDWKLMAKKSVSLDRRSLNGYPGEVIIKNKKKKWKATDLDERLIATFNLLPPCDQITLINNDSDQGCSSNALDALVEQTLREHEDDDGGGDQSGSSSDSSAPLESRRKGLRKRKASTKAEEEDKSPAKKKKEKDVLTAVLTEMKGLRTEMAGLRSVLNQLSAAYFFKNKMVFIEAKNLK